MLCLQHEYPSVINCGRTSYGGSQLWFNKKNMQQCGCGVIACGDVFLYLSHFHPELGLPDYGCVHGDKPMLLNEYEDYISSLSPRYFPLIPHFGINGISLVLGLKRIIGHYNSVAQISWGEKKDRLIDSIEDMLRRDTPVILAIGPNFPLLLGNKQVNFYTLSSSGECVKTVSTRSHYVVVTALDDNWMQISSWGRKYYLNVAEYLLYIDQHSSPIVSNIVRIS